PNGVFAYGAGSVFPNQTNGVPTNYFVDVLFSNSVSTASLGPPEVQSVSPTPGSTNVDFNAPLTATFNEAVQASTISFVVKNSSNNVVAGSVTYNSSTNVATFTPTSSLAGSTTFTATVSGAKDQFGNVMTGPYSWSFTTFQALGPGPFTIWPATAVP